MLCCSACIGDRWLTREVIPKNSTQSGVCSFCQCEDRLLIEPETLRNSIYQKKTNGRSLTEWLKDDWAMFPELDLANAKNLLAEILDDGEIVRANFVPSDLSKKSQLDLWQQLKTELMHKNRFFPETRFDTERLSELLSQLFIDSKELPQEWYRARIQNEKEPIPIAKMSSPPPRLASQGRANPAGIPYLYIATNPETAISEIRPHTGELASVARFEIGGDMSLIDLRNPRVSISPFILGDEDEVALLRGDIEFLVRLGQELTHPVLPDSVNIDYIPSQYLCEFIKKCGYDGVIYRSSVGEGINAALFSDEMVNPLDVSRYEVSKVSVEIQQNLP